AGGEGCLERSACLPRAAVPGRRHRSRPQVPRRPSRTHPRVCAGQGRHRSRRPPGVRLPGHEPGERGREPRARLSSRLLGPPPLAGCRRARDGAFRPLGELPRTRGRGGQVSETTTSYAALRARAIESLLIEKGYLTEEAVDYVVSAYEHDIGPMRGARLVAHAWVD